jgi:hypothetical protein
MEITEEEEISEIFEPAESFTLLSSPQNNKV